MTSIFGGEQTVPTTQNQFTNQSFNQTQQGQQNQTQTQAYAANPVAAGVGNQLAAMAMNLGNGPYFGGSPTGAPPTLDIADLTPEQLTGIGNLTSQGYAQGNALPSIGNAYLQGGAQGIYGAGQGITPWDIGSFYNPMAANVTANLQDIFNQQNLAARVGGTSATGGVGGDRAAVAQALLAKQQGLSAGQTYAGLYQSALQAAQQQKAQQLQAGNALAGLGLPTIQAGFGALGQGLQAASIPQAQQQAINQARYQQALGLYQQPYMTLGAVSSTVPTLAGLGGVGTSAASGTTQAGVTGAQSGFGTGQQQTTYPAPSPFSQIAGLGSLALGAGMLFGGSDKRAKTDIQPYGKDKATGLKMYAYRYKGDPKTYPKVVGPMAQDIEKKYPGTTTKFARGGGIQHFQYGGGEDQGQQQDSNYLTGFTDYQPMAGSEGSDAPTPPYAEEQSTWDPKRIFSPDRLQKAQRAIMLGQRATAQSQVARPRVAPITFPQVPWKSGITFARGGRLAINLPALSRAMTQQEGGRVDAATADSWGGHKVWRPGMRWNFESDYGERGVPFAPDKGTGGRPNFPMRLVPPAAGRYPTLDMRRSPEGVYRLGGSVRGYDDGGEVFPDPLAGMDPMPESEPEPPGLPEYGDMPDTGDEDTAGAVPLPRPRPPGAGQGIPFTPGAGPAAPAGGGGPSLFGRPVSPGAMALIQAGLGMLAASGQRDARGLPMSGLAAIGKGGGTGLETYQSMQNQQQKDLLARDALAQRNTLAQQQLAMRERAQERLEAAAEETRRLNRAREANWERERRRPVKMTDIKTGEEYLVRPETGARIVPPQDPYAVPPPSSGPGVIEPPTTRTAQTETPQEEGRAFTATTPFNYLEGIPQDIEAGSPVPKPIPFEGVGFVASPEAMEMDAFKYLQTGAEPKTPMGRSPVAISQRKYNAAVRNYAAALAKSSGMSLEQAADLWKYSKREAGWLMGADGRQAGSLGTLVDHLDTMKVLTTALQNGDNQTYNLIKNKVAKWTGKEYPTNVQAGAQIVGAEIMKAVGAAGAGTGVEREAAGLNLGDLAKSPQQFAGSIDTVQRLAAGQLRTKYRQAEALASGDRLFKQRLDTLIGKRALEILTSLDEGPQESHKAQPFTAVPDQRQRALDWLKANPNDPDAPAVRRKLGVQ